jgi:hypothetical protein
VKVFAALQDTNWHTEFHVEIRNAATGQVLLTRDGSNTTAVSEGSLPPDQTLSIAGGLSPPGGAEVVCVVTGTHTPAGAPFSPIAATQGTSEFNNVFNCDVN